MWILGLNNMHEASAALVHDGILVAAAELFLPQHRAFGTGQHARSRGGAVGQG